MDFILEFVHLGVVFGDRTIIEQLNRVPFDGCLRRHATEHLSRFIYEPCEFDYVDELAQRLRRAVERRIDHPGRKGLLLDGSDESRTILACHPKVDECYTVGRATDPKVGVARTVSERYEATHTMLEMVTNELDVTPGEVLYPP